MHDNASALHQLCEQVGIASGYRDTWEREHETSDETRLALLRAMGVINEASEAAAAMRDRRDRESRRRLPAVCVRREDELPYLWEIGCGEETAKQALRWTLALENGETRSGETSLDELQLMVLHETDGQRRVKMVFKWHEPLPSGYHRFRLEPADAGGEAAAMTLIIVPARCYMPPGLEDGTRVWGPALQLYAVRSGRNWGIGDFTDLRNAVELMAGAGAGVVGVNPLHALFPHDPGHISPYSPSSRAYLNPLYIDIEGIPGYNGCPEARDLVAEPRFQARLRALRSAQFVDYPGLSNAKLEVLRTVYQAFRAHDLRDATPRAAAFSRFLAEGGEPLLQFALYHALQEDFHARDAAIWGWPVWPEPFRNPAAPAVRAFLESHRERVEFHAWLQWIADEQLAACGQRSRELGLTVGLYLDLAVSIARAGAEAWAWQDLYATAATIGAPPDAFNLRGQDWGLPPMVPERLTESAYAPFIATLRANMRHAGALRIDHVMGLARLYWVPRGATPGEGAYVGYPVRDLLGILALESQRNRCMVIGEDLGTLPEGLDAQLTSANVLSCRLLLFEKEPGATFKPPAAYPRQALAAATTHDLPTLKGFWQGHDLDVRAHLNLYPSDVLRRQQVEERARDRARLLAALEREGLLPAGVSIHPASAPEMTPGLALAIHAYLARSPAQLMTVQMEDVLGQLEQVNLPATSGEYPNWQRKLPLDLDVWVSDARVRAFTELLCGERSGSDRAAVPRR